MRACLHLYSETSDDSVFYQMLIEDIMVNENDSFDYSEMYYDRLDSQAKKSFDRNGLKVGKYTVIATRTEPNAYWGEIRYIFLRPVE